MLIKEWQLSDYKTKLSHYNSILIYGPDRGKVSEIKNLLLEELKIHYKEKLEILKISEDLLVNRDFFIQELINQKSIFFDKTIILINLDLIKPNKDDIEFLKEGTVSSSNLVIFESANLTNDHFLLNEFKKQDNFLCVPCYQDNEKNLRNTILHYANKYQLNLDESTITYLIKKMGNDRMITEQEIKKLALYADNKSLSFTEVIECIGDNSILGIYKISDNLMLNNNINMNYSYDRLVNSGINYFIILRALTKHLHLLLLAKILGYKSVKEIKPPLHFSRHGEVQKQINSLNIEKIESALVELNTLEKSCKLSPTLSSILIKKFLISFKP